MRKRGCKKRAFRPEYLNPLFQVVTASETAKICSVSIWTVYNWCNTGKIAARLSETGRGWLISLPSIVEFMRDEYNITVIC
jgi:predicted site-specific integrase-resolvase